MKKWLFILISIVMIGFAIVLMPTKPNNGIYNKIQNQLKEHKSEFKNARFAIIIDYNKPIYKKRLWIIEIESAKVLANYHVSHALKSGLIYPTKFSNKVGSNLSSKGTFKTLNSYESTYGKGKYKIGMRLQGLDKGINDNVFKRNIVFHSSYGFWSSGCFMTLPKINKKIIDFSKNGNILIVI